MLRKLIFLSLVVSIGSAIDCMTASASLIAYYALNGNLNDTSGNGNNGTAGPDLTFGNGGITSTGTDANQYFTSPVNINLLPQVTFGGWFEATSTNPTRGLIANDTGGFGRGIDIDTRGAGDGYSAFNGAGVFGGSILPTGAPTFDFVAVTYDRTNNTQTLDVNGNFVTSTGTSPPNGQNVLTIGKNPSFDMPFGGTIKDVFIYNTALTPTQLNAIQASGVLTPEPSSFVLGGLGIVGLLLAARRRHSFRAHAQLTRAGILIAVVIAGTQSTHAAIINFQLGVGQNGAIAPLYTGLGAATDPGGTTWNEVGASGGTATLDSHGNVLANGPKLSVTTNQTYNGGGGNTLLDYWDFATQTQPFSITNIPNTHYNLFIYAANGGFGDGRTTDFTIGSTTLPAFDNQPDNVGFIKGTNYVEFTNITAPGGVISGTYVSSSGQAQFNGVQLQAITPEPSSFVLGGLGVVGLLLAARRRRKASRRSPSDESSKTARQPPGRFFVA